VGVAVGFGRLVFQSAGKQGEEVSDVVEEGGGWVVENRMRGCVGWVDLEKGPCQCSLCSFVVILDSREDVE
jgi:hypothetical protein